MTNGVIGSMPFAHMLEAAAANIRHRVAIAAARETVRAEHHLEHIHRSLGQKFRQVRERAHRDLQDYDGSIFWLKP